MGGDDWLTGSAEALRPDSIQTARAESVGLVLCAVLETLTPVERLVFVLHHLFAMPLDDIAVIVGCSPAVTRELADRGRRRVQGA
ncbi:sigma factor-like helix-turn-helix DNA-binding protein [Streptomyces sp. SID13031]|uniref:sigma factor-like helix-turn-helix DNA-binding protein n=1 Tax=Streptomyces sp. SID13031 TaxID=2706046 RepID=UPI0013C86688|nr:hypothetical protein [Streptomyces sp. SID13031]